METNTLPRFDDSINDTGCCPRFDPQGWDGRDLHFRDKLFLRAVTHSIMHIPVDMGRVFTRVNEHIEDEGAYDPDDFIVLSRDTSAWNAEHLFAVTKPVKTEEMVTLSGDFRTAVFEGPYRQTKEWYELLTARQETERGAPGRIYFFYTTCPKCAKAYGKNYIVGVYEV